MVLKLSSENMIAIDMKAGRMNWGQIKGKTRSWRSGQCYSCSCSLENRGNRTIVVRARTSGRNRREREKERENGRKKKSEVVATEARQILSVDCSANAAAAPVPNDITAITIDGREKQHWEPIDGRRRGLPFTGQKSRHHLHRRFEPDWEKERMCLKLLKFSTLDFSRFCVA